MVCSIRHVAAALIRIGDDMVIRKLKRKVIATNIGSKYRQDVGHDCNYNLCVANVNVAAMIELYAMIRLPLSVNIIGCINEKLQELSRCQ